MRIWIAVQVLILVMLATGSLGRENALILADEIHYLRPERSFSAFGNVKVYFAGNVLHAQGIDYADGVITTTGPLSFTYKHGTVGVAEFAELDEEFQRGVLKGVQMLLADRIRIIGSRVEMAEDNFTQISNAMVVTCRVCRPDQPPIWHFRSRRVVHDKENRQLHLQHVNFYVGNTKLLYLPYLRLPDPSINRKSGFLLPEMTYSNLRGFWAKVPYFQTLGNHADITFTPGVTTKGNLSLGVQHRQLFRRGRITTEINALWDRRHAEEFRGHIKFFGDLDLGNEFMLAFSGEDVTDSEFLKDFGISTEASVTSSARVTRRSRFTWFDLGSRHINRLEDQTGTIPHLIHDARYGTRFTLAPGAGSVGLKIEAQSYERKAKLSGPNGQSGGVSSASVTLDWRNNWILDDLFVLSAVGLARFDTNRIKNNPATTGSHSRFLQTAALELRLPLRQVEGPGQHVIEPFAQLVWTPDRLERDDGIPNEDSILVEFDETNLLSVNRFPGNDRSEQGTHFNLGIRHTGRLASGTELEFVFGRVFRKRDLGQFDQNSGLSGKRSHYVAAGRIGLVNSIVIDQRAVFDADFGIAKSESFIRHGSNDFEIAAGYSRLRRNDGANMTNDVESAVFFARRNFDNEWAANTTLEYDFNKEGENSVGIGLEYRNQCLLVEFNAERQMSTVSRPNADNKLNLKLSLGGFSDLSNRAPSDCGA